MILRVLSSQTAEGGEAAPRRGGLDRAVCVRSQRTLRPDEQPASRSELVEDIGRKLTLPPTLLELMRERARGQDE